MFKKTIAAFLIIFITVCTMGCASPTSPWSTDPTIVTPPVNEDIIDPIRFDKKDVYGIDVIGDSIYSFDNIPHETDSSINLP